MLKRILLASVFTTALAATTEINPAKAATVKISDSGDLSELVTDPGDDLILTVQEGIDLEWMNLLDNTIIKFEGNEVGSGSSGSVSVGPGNILIWGLPDDVYIDNDIDGKVVPFVLNRVEKVPEPLTILGSATALGIGGLLKRENSKKQKKI